MTVTTNLKALSEIDDSLWLEETIVLLKEKRFKDLDIDNLVEELEALGKRDFNKLKSLLRQIIIHLLLLQYWSNEYERNYRHWQSEITTFRFDLNNNLTTNFKNKLINELESIYKSAVKFVKIKADLKNIPEYCPYTLEQLLDENYYLGVLQVSRVRQKNLEFGLPRLRLAADIIQNVELAKPEACPVRLSIYYLMMDLFPDAPDKNGSRTEEIVSLFLINKSVSKIHCGQNRGSGYSILNLNGNNTVNYF